MTLFTRIPLIGFLVSRAEASRAMRGSPEGGPEGVQRGAKGGPEGVKRVAKGGQEGVQRGARGPSGPRLDPPLDPTHARPPLAPLDLLWTYDHHLY